jgi:hypothetical protein
VRQRGRKRQRESTSETEREKETERTSETDAERERDRASETETERETVTDQHSMPDLHVIRILKEEEKGGA